MEKMNLEEKFGFLEGKLGIRFSDKALLIQAFCHRSYLNENAGFDLQNNERLEFLGDAVLELAITDFLYKSYPGEPEGELTNWRASLVNAKMLAVIAQESGFNDFLLLSRGEAKEEGKARQYILANTFEAFVGALYLDQGYGICKDFIEERVAVKLPNILKEGLHKDAKSRFQEQAQEKESITPIYKVLKETGPDHAKNFTMGVFLGSQLIAEGQGSSKQEAEDNAAKKALEIKNW